MPVSALFCAPLAIVGRDLGAQMTYSKLVRKEVFQQRLQSVANFWTSLYGFCFVQKVGSENVSLRFGMGPCWG